MASTTESLKQRVGATVEKISPSNQSINSDDQRAKKVAMAKRGLRTLSIAIALPVILTILSYYLSGGATSAKQQMHGTTKRGFWYPPAWALYAVSASCAGLNGLAAWMVWADGGFHRRPNTLGLYLVQVLLGLVWGPVALSMGSAWGGMVVSGLLLAAMFVTARSFKEVNPIAADLVKPCFVWGVFLAVFSYKLM